MNISDHFTFKKYLRFVFPSIVMMIFTSLYGVVDGFFISNYAGKTAFAAVNLTMPLLMILGTVGFMVGTGGSALVSKTLGEKDEKKANEIFSMLVYVVAAIGIVFTIVARIFLEKIVVALGADREMLPYCVLYGRVNLCSLTFFMLQNVFRSFLTTAGKPKVGLAVTITAGVLNMIMDLLFVGIFRWGIVGAVVATTICETIGGAVPLVYFARKNSSTLKLVKFRFYPKALLKTCTNGASELMTTFSTSFVNMFYNLRLMKFYGQNGVAAYGTIMYVNFVFIAAFLGFSIGLNPIVGYNYGAKNHDELKNVFKKSLVIVSGMAAALVLISTILAPIFSKLYVGYDKELLSLTVFAFRLFATSYLVCGFNIFASAFFTALNNGAISAGISFSRTFLFRIISVFALPAIFGRDAIWLSITVAEIFTLVLSGVFLKVNKKKYHY